MDGRPKDPHIRVWRAAVAISNDLCIILHVLCVRYSQPATSGECANMYCDGWPACSWKDIHCQETIPVPQLDWCMHQRWVFVVMS